MDFDRVVGIWGIQFADKMKSPMLAKVDGVVADFTKNILELARKNKVDFAYTGARGDQRSEIKRTLRIDVDTAKKLLEK